MTTTAHVHRWLLSSPHAVCETVDAVCRGCGERTTYPAWDRVAKWQTPVRVAKSRASGIKAMHAAKETP